MAFHMVSSQCDQRHGFISPQVLDLTFPFGALAEFLVILFLLSVKVPLMAADPSDVSTTFPVLYFVEIA